MKDGQIYTADRSLHAYLCFQTMLELEVKVEDILCIPRPPKEAEIFISFRFRIAPATSNQRYLDHVESFAARMKHSSRTHDSLMCVCLYMV